MSYIGNTVNNQGFTPAIDYFNGDGTTVTFTLSRPVVSVAQMIVAIDNVIQNPSSAFTVSGNSITFTSAPLAGTNNIWVEYTSLITTYNTISQDPSVIGDITATGGFLAVGDFGNTYTDGTIVDYVTGNARITTGPADGLTIYNGGTASRTALTTWTAAGNVGIGTSSPTAKLTVDATNAGYTNGIDISNTTSFGYGSSINFKNIPASGGSLTTVAQIQQYYQASNKYGLTFSKYDSGLGEAMRIDSSGNVGIGQSSPTAKLHVVGEIYAAQATANTQQIRLTPQASDANIIYSTYAGTNSYLPLAFNVGGAERMRIDTSGNVQVNGYSSNGSASSLRIGNVTDYQGRFYLDSSPELFYIENTSDYSLSGIAFKTNNSERMRITSGGDLLVGTTSTYSSSYRMSLAPASGTGGIVFKNASTSPHYPYTFLNSSGTTVGYIEAANTATTYVTTSDYRLKENIAPMTGALEKIAQLKPVTYKWKSDGSDGQGFIAHELQAVVPECVTGEKDAVETYTDEEGNEQTRIKPQGVDTSFLVATLTAAIQEQQAIIEDLKARIETLEAK